MLAVWRRASRPQPPPAACCLRVTVRGRAGPCGELLFTVGWWVVEEGVRGSYQSGCSGAVGRAAVHACVSVGAGQNKRRINAAQANRRRSHAPASKGNPGERAAGRGQVHAPENRKDATGRALFISFSIFFSFLECNNHRERQQTKKGALFFVRNINVKNKKLNEVLR